MNQRSAGAVIGAAAVMALVAGPVSAAGTDKTLVSWVTLANTTQRGGSALTVQSGRAFDGIVFGEKVAGKWMVGSFRLARTQVDQQANAVEMADDKTLIQMAVVYQGRQITLYRDGERYAAYETDNIDLLSNADTQSVFGPRCEGVGLEQNLQGSIEDARIYGRALTADEIKKLKPNQPSEIKPYAWWTFEKGKETDLMGNFPINNLDGGAKIQGGRLILQGGRLIATAYKVGGDVETPAMRANRPASWPTYHLFHPGPGAAFPGDPNSAFYWKGRYHLHYIYYSPYQKGYCFAHVSSTDMVHWTWHPTVLTPKTTGHGMFSGTGFFTKEGKPVHIYHGQGSDKNWLAYPLDDTFDGWSKPEAVVAKTEDGQPNKAKQWDPDCWLNGDTYYSINGGSNPSLLKSSDLKEWKPLGPLLHDAYPASLDVAKGEDISCPNMFKIGKKWMLLSYSHGLGCHYYLGDFKNEKYLPDSHARMTWNGKNFGPPESMLAKDGRRVMWAWLMMSAWSEMKDVPIQPQMSLPRELELPEDGVLKIRPLRELEALRYDMKQEKGITVGSDAAHRLRNVSGDALELGVTFKAPSAKEFGVEVLCDKDGANGLRIAVLAESKTLRVGNVNAPFELKAGEDLILRVFVDRNLVEVFANDRQAAVTAIKLVPENLGVRLFSKGGAVVVREVKGWKMKSIYSSR